MVDYQQLGNTGVFVSRICFGAMTLGGSGSIYQVIGGLPQAEADKLIVCWFSVKWREGAHPFRCPSRGWRAGLRSVSTSGWRVILGYPEESKTARYSNAILRQRCFEA